MFREARRRRSLLASFALAGVLILATPAVSSADHDEKPSVTDGFPTVEGAPFFPDPGRSEVVNERAELLQELDQLSQADAELTGRRDVDSTRQAIASRRAGVERRLDELQPAIDALADSTAPFGLLVAAFPVDELRKPFRDDWGEPRSGGRRHAGNDFLAHIGIPLRAIEDGTFDRLSTGGLGGLGVFLTGDSGADYLYVHLDSVLPFEDGQRIYAGQIIGTVGDSGNARGAPHLHLQVAPEGELKWDNPHELMAELFGPLDQGQQSGVLGASTTSDIDGDDELRNADYNEPVADDTDSLESRLNQLLTTPEPVTSIGFRNVFERTISRRLAAVQLTPINGFR